MAYWLFKSEPGAWSWDDQVAKGAEGEGWTMANNMKAMVVGDRGFFYHSVDEKRIVGIVEVIETYHPDPTDESGRFGMVTIKAVKPVAKPVTLADIKAEPRLEGFALVRQSRLSVVPVTDEQWALLCAMAETEA